MLWHSMVDLGFGSFFSSFPVAPTSCSVAYVARFRECGTWWHNVVVFLHCCCSVVVDGIRQILKAVYQVQVCRKWLGVMQRVSYVFEVD